MLLFLSICFFEMVPFLIYFRHEKEIVFKLYGLLEEARQHAKIIIATSTKLDALDSLEKRIKSRFASSGNTFSLTL